MNAFFFCLPWTSCNAHNRFLFQVFSPSGVRRDIYNRSHALFFSFFFVVTHIQDLKNQILTTNVWVEHVSRSLYPSSSSVKPFFSIVFPFQTYMYVFILPSISSAEKGASIVWGGVYVWVYCCWIGQESWMKWENGRYFTVLSSVFLHIYLPRLPRLARPRFFFPGREPIRRNSK